MNSIKSIRNSFKREGLFGVLNIVGLSIGMAMSLLIIWYLQYHLSFDSQIPEKDMVYRVVEKDRNDGALSFGNPLPMAQTIRNDYPGVGKVAALESSVYTVSCDENEFSIKTSAADATIFDVLGMDILVGSKDILSDPGSSVITRSCAQKLFGKAEPLGKTFSVKLSEKEKIFTVKGIIADPPVNSDFNSEIYLPWGSTIPSNWEKLWWWGGRQILVRVENSAEKENLEQSINTILERHQAPYINGRYDYELVSLAGSHFRTDITNSLSSPVSAKLIWILGIIAAFIIVTACINFVNLSIGQSERNSKETGIHKVLGASRNSLVKSFLSVTFFKTILAMALALLLTKLLASPFQELAQINDFDLFSSRVIWLVLSAIVLFAGLLSGVYPAFVVSRPKPIELLTSKKRNVPSANAFRNSLVVVQLSIASILIIASLFVFKQISFMKNHDLGFDKNGLLAVDVSYLDEDFDKVKEKAQILEQEIMKCGAQNGIESVAATEVFPGAYCRNSFTITNPENMNTYSVPSIGIDENYADVLDVPVIEGRNFSRELSSDAGAILINETFKKKLGWNSIENKQLALFNADNKVSVIGVFKDMNINSLSQAVPPMIFRYKKNAYPEYMVLRIKQGREATALPVIKNEWEKISGGKQFDLYNVADEFNAMYGSEERISKIIAAFCLVAILLSGFGLLSNIAFSVQQRTKEIGVRKVNGAKVSEILVLLNKDFVIFVLAAFVLATPITYFAMNKWLENFAYKTNLSWWIFAIAGLLALGIALLTVSWQSWRAATRNPVEALRYE